jgi:hypothetical protein
MFGGVVPYSSAGRKNYNRWGSGKQIEKAEGTKVNISSLINGRGKTDGPWCNGMLQIVLSFSWLQILQVKYHPVKYPQKLPHPNNLTTFHKFL